MKYAFDEDCTTLDIIGHITKVTKWLKSQVVRPNFETWLTEFLMYYTGKQNRYEIAGKPKDYSKIFSSFSNMWKVTNDS